MVDSFYRWIAASYQNVNQSLYYDFNATTLNASAASINQDLQNNVVGSPGYLFATLTAENATVTIPGSNSSSSGQDASGANPSNNTDLAM